MLFEKSFRIEIVGCSVRTIRRINSGSKSVNASSAIAVVRNSSSMATLRRRLFRFHMPHPSHADSATTPMLIRKLMVEAVNDQ